MFNAKIKLIDKSLQISYDVEGFKYDLPIFIINEPVGFIEKKKIEKSFEDKDIIVF